jgi:hypothetical protein
MAIESRTVGDGAEYLDHGHGRYDVDEYSLDPFPGTNVSA